MTKTVSAISPELFFKGAIKWQSVINGKPYTDMLITREHVCVTLGVSLSTFDNLKRKGEIPESLNIFNKEYWSMRAISAVIYKSYTTVNFEEYTPQILND